MKSRKVMSITLEGFHLECRKVDESTNPYRLYRIYDGGRKKQLAKYADFMSIMQLTEAIFRYGIDSMTLADLIKYCKTKQPL